MLDLLILNTLKITVANNGYHKNKDEQWMRIYFLLIMHIYTHSISQHRRY